MITCAYKTDKRHRTYVYAVVVKHLNYLMNNKFIRVLIIINGILIPFFILLILFNLFKEEYYKPKSFDSQFEESEGTEPKYEIKQSSIIKVPNSENYMVAEYKKPISDFIRIVEEINLPYDVPKIPSI